MTHDSGSGQSDGTAGVQLRPDPLRVEQRLQTSHRDDELSIVQLHLEG